MKIPLLALVISITLVSSTPEELRLKHFNLNEGLALQGYDPVSYFKDKKALVGSKDFLARYKGILYRFSSSGNKALFIANASQYEPEYGGWCAYAMGSRGAKVDVDPETFKIVNGKLYLFYNKFVNNTLTDWNKNEPSLLSKADAYWLKIFK
jgi:YHS domain-containing protein